MLLSAIRSALLAGLAIANPTPSTHDKREPVSCLEIGKYFDLINTALVSVNYVRNSPHPCNLDLIPVFEARGLDGIYAMELICLYDAGVNLFSNKTLTQVNDDLIIALIGLFDAAANDSGPARNLSCVNLDVEVLNDIALPGAAIKDIICQSGHCTVPLDNNVTTSATTGTPSSIAIAATSSLCYSNSTTPSSSISSVSTGVSSASSGLSVNSIMTASVFASVVGSNGYTVVASRATPSSDSIGISGSLPTNAVSSSDTVTSTALGPAGYHV